MTDTPLPFTPDQMKRGLLNLDFETWFPHKFWVSTWSKDNTYPNGYRYKMLSARNEKEQAIQMVILVEETNGNKTVLLDDLMSPVEYFEYMSQTMLKGLETSFHIQFDEGLGLSDVRTSDEFDRRTDAAGWYSQKP